MRIYTKLTNRYFPLFFLLVTTLFGCTSDQSPNVESEIQNQILHMGNGTEPQGLDPHIVTGVTEHNIIMSLLEGLVGIHPATLAPEPAVAESWEINEDGTRYIFHLRKNAKWSNGDLLTAHDFVYSWNRALTPALGNQYAYMLYPVINAEEYNTGEISDFNQVGIKALDDNTLEVVLKSSTPYFLGLLDHDSTFPIHQATIEKHGDIDTRDSKWTRAGNFVGNGPFILKHWEQNRIIIVEKNPHYWDASIVKLNEIHFYPTDQTATEERMFRTGKLHITNSVPIEKIGPYKKENPNLIKIYPYLGTYYYDINSTIPPLDNVNIRRALAMSIDRRSIVENITKGGQQPAYSLTPPDTLGYTAHAAIPYDLVKAKQLLAEAGFPNGEGFPKLQLLYNTLESHQQIAVAIQQMWKQALNIDITLTNQEWKVYLDTRSAMDFQIARASWIGDYVDPNTFLDMFVTSGGNNHTGWSNDEYDQLIAQAAITADQDIRYKLFQRAEKILVDEVPIIPIYTYARIFLQSPEVKGWHPNILDRHPYKYVYLESNNQD
jgi:oligopeptide transport system substrate-binding protein